MSALVDEVRKQRIGGTYWGAQPESLPSGFKLVRLRDRGARDGMLKRCADEQVVCWTESAERDVGVRSVSGCCDPWYLLDRASELVTDVRDEVVAIAAIIGVPVRFINGEEAEAGADLAGPLIAAFDYRNPFTGDTISAADAVELCAFWRRLIDSNRGIAAAIGFGFWKQETVAPLLWSGGDPVRFLSSARSVAEGEPVAVWKARTPPAVLRQLEQKRVRTIEVEDGFIRSAGLGADCVPPLSVTTDRLGAHFDPSRSSELEKLLETADVDERLLERARELRELIVASGISKYEAGRSVPPRTEASQAPTILVPGQVEDDRAVVCGGQGLTSNLELLQRVRGIAPAARILYKPHPDVEAGHRRGALPDGAVLAYADEVARGGSISGLIDAVDEVHVNTSLAGFEALLRGKRVTTHGMPFYAGWGLTTDLGSVPERRSRRRSLDELVALVLLVYPRYLDPVTRLPCPPEVLVRRLSDAPAERSGLVVRLRRLQGGLKRRLAGIGAR